MLNKLTDWLIYVMCVVLWLGKLSFVVVLVLIVENSAYLFSIIWPFSIILQSLWLSIYSGMPSDELINEVHNSWYAIFSFIVIRLVCVCVFFTLHAAQFHSRFSVWLRCEYLWAPNQFNPLNRIVCFCFAITLIVCRFCANSWKFPCTYFLSHSLSLSRIYFSPSLSLPLENEQKTYSAQRQIVCKTMHRSL